MNTSLKLILLTIATLLIAAPARAEWRAKFFPSTNQTWNDFKRPIEEWINQQRPKDLNSIKAFLSQNLRSGPGGDYNIWVYVDSADEGKPAITVALDYRGIVRPGRSAITTTRRKATNPATKYHFTWAMIWA